MEPAELLIRSHLQPKDLQVIPSLPIHPSATPRLSGPATSTRTHSNFKASAIKAPSCDQVEDGAHVESPGAFVSGLGRIEHYLPSGKSTHGRCGTQLNPTNLEATLNMLAEPLTFCVAVRPFKGSKAQACQQDFPRPGNRKIG